MDDLKDLPLDIKLLTIFGRTLSKYSDEDIEAIYNPNSAFWNKDVSENYSVRDSN